MPLIYKGKKEMKKYLLLALLLTVGLNAQVMMIGDTLDLKTYSGTNLVLLLHYGAGTEEGAGLFRKVDSAYVEDGINAFDYPYDGYQWARVNLLSGGRNFNQLTTKYLTLTANISVGTGAFTTTDAEDTVVVSGISASDIFIVSGKYKAGVDQQDVLQWRAVTDTLFVTRLASGESAGTYSWLRIKQ